MNKSHKRMLQLAGGFLSGLINGLFGGGGGTVCLPLLRRSGLEQKEASATTLGVMFPVSCLSLLLLWVKKGPPEHPLLPFFLASLPGALLGACLLNKMKGVWLRRLFGGLLILAACRMLFAG